MSIYNEQLAQALCGFELNILPGAHLVKVKQETVVIQMELSEDNRDCSIGTGLIIGDLDDLSRVSFLGRIMQLTACGRDTWKAEVELTRTVLKAHRSTNWLFVGARTGEKQWPDLTSKVYKVVREKGPVGKIHAELQELIMERFIGFCDVYRINTARN